MPEQLAIEGGTPVRATPLSYGRQWIEEDDIAAVTDTLRSDFLTCGPKIAELEEALCAYTGAEHAVVMNSGTAPLHAAVHAAGIGAGDEVIVTPLTFAASANAALYTGARPVFADIDKETWNIDPECVEACITPRTKAVMAVDFAGETVDADALRDLCDRHGLFFFEDAAHAIGSEHRGRRTGSYADITTMSFHPVKTVTAGEGGAFLTNREEFAHKAALFRSHGIERDPARMGLLFPEGTGQAADAPEEPESSHSGACEETAAWVYDQMFLGYNFRMPDLNASLLLSQLKKIDRFVARRKEIVAAYEEAFADLPEIAVQKKAPWSDAARHLFVIRLDPEKLCCTRRQFFDAMRAENIFCQVHYIPTYFFSHYRKLGYEKGLCPVAEEVYGSSMSIPLFPKMTDGDVQDVIQAVRKLVGHWRK